MKVTPIMILTVSLLFGFETFAQEYPVISEEERIERLNAPEGKVRMVLDTDTYNEIDDQFAVVYALLQKRNLMWKPSVCSAFLQQPIHRS